MIQDKSCIFCKIISREIPATLVKESEDYVVIRDINPQAPTHILIVPKEHVPNIVQFEQADKLGRLFQAAKELMVSEKLDSGFRLVVNTGVNGGQTVDHLHIHMLGGRNLNWPPG